MEGREDEVSCHRCLHRDRRTLEVSYLTDHDDIGILTKERLESCRIRIVLSFVDFTLYDPRKFIFYRVFESDDLSVLSIERCEHRVEGCCLTASCRTSDEDGATFFRERFLDLTLRRPHESEFFHARDRLRRIQYSTYSIFSVSYRKGRDTDVDTRPIITDSILSILRNIGDIELEIGFVLEALEQELVFSFFESRDCH